MTEMNLDQALNQYGENKHDFTLMSKSEQTIGTWDGFRTKGNGRTTSGSAFFNLDSEMLKIVRDKSNYKEKDSLTVGTFQLPGETMGNFVGKNIFIIGKDTKFIINLGYYWNKQWFLASTINDYTFKNLNKTDLRF